jgi:hypothetical protein
MLLMMTYYSMFKFFDLNIKGIWSPKLCSGQAAGVIWLNLMALQPTCDIRIAFDFREKNQVVKNGFSPKKLCPGFRAKVWR